MFNLAAIHEAIAAVIPERECLIFRERRLSWAQVTDRTRRLASVLRNAGLGCSRERAGLANWESGQSHVGLYLYNGNEYLEGMLGAFKARCVPLNVNYRYVDEELEYLFDNSDARAIVFHASFAPVLARIRSRLPKLQLWLQVDDGSGEPLLPGALDYEQALAAAEPRPPGPDLSPDDLYMLYTGGTTGMPKGVMWRQDDLFGALDASNRRRMPPEQDLDALGGRVVAAGPRNLPAAPLMHGTGFFNAVSNLMLGGSVTTMVGRRFDTVELLDTVERFSINSMAIVGDAFAKPILRALDTDPGRWDISSLRVIVSSGVIWSRETKDGLLRHNDRLIMVDSLGSSEAIGMATNTTRAGEGSGTARFSLGATTRVVTEDGRDVEPGSGERGHVALRGFTPVGYYKDPEKSAATFQVIDGVRYSIPGDWAEVEADGTVKLLGRGSQCINTGGEKVYPEEVEEALKLHPSVHDAAVVGVPDDRFGEAITALVEPNPGATIDEAELIAHVKEKLAAFKAPKRVLPVSTVARAANGKLDYRQLRSDALARLDLTRQDLT
jgi:acyl-CoA synthetase (AMP-forming)/AMP-acid ligase II